MEEMNALKGIFEKTKHDLRNKISELECAIERIKDRYHAEKARRRHQLTEEELKRKKLNDEIHELNNWIFELDNKRAAAEEDTRKAEKEIQKLKKNSFVLKKMRTAVSISCATRLWLDRQRKMS
jgi:hypothetical protein